MNTDPKHCFSHASEGVGNEPGIAMLCAFAFKDVLGFCIVVNRVAEPETRAEEPKLNCLLELSRSRNHSGSFLFIKDLKKFYRK